MKLLPRTLRTRVNEAVALRIGKQVDPVHEELRHWIHRTEEMDKRLSEVERRLDDVERESSWSANELARIAPQVAAFETRLEQTARPEVLTGELADLPEARNLVETIREEHARVRARLALVSAYEERLRRLEARILQAQNN